MTTVPTRSIVVTGMTCHHCACAVRTEISMLPGITDVDVGEGTVRISGEPLPGDASLREAVGEAGTSATARNHAAVALYRKDEVERDIH